MRDRWHDMAQAVRHLAVLTKFVSLKRHDLARYIAGHCGNKIRASVRLALFCSRISVSVRQKKIDLIQHR